jgi:CHRD domain
MTKIILIALAFVAFGPLSASMASARSDTGRTFVAQLSGSQEVPPHDTHAHGAAIFHVSKDGSQIDYQLVVGDIDNVVMAHIHLGAEGVNGPVVAFLLHPQAPAGGPSHGVIAAGTITTSDLVGPLAGMTLDDLISAIQAGNIYANVHTDDGVAPPNTGPGDFPGGEIRGQLH